jgi:hypothetical protein
VLRREDIRRSCGAQDDVDEAGGGLARAGVMETLGGGWRSFGSTLRRHCFDDVTGWPGLDGGGGARGTAAHVLKAQRHGKAECSVAVFMRKRAERKIRRIVPQRGSYRG